MQIRVILSRSLQSASKQQTMKKQNIRFSNRIQTAVLCVGLMLSISAAVFPMATVLIADDHSRSSITIILVRHAERVDVPPENKDPDLSPAGMARAQELARVFGDAGIAAIYATQYKRTQQTVKPLADKLGLQITQVEAKKTAELVKQIKARNVGQVILIAGHNNSVPEIIAALGGPQLPVIPLEQFDNVYILTVNSDGSTKLLKMKYGSPILSSGQGMTKP
jgi:broad specificity phosphatase PhoE